MPKSCETANTQTKTALVTGATRGIGRGVAATLAESGFKVFATGRSIQSSFLPESVTRIKCDHTEDSQTQVVFDRVLDESHRLDLLVNCAWGGYERMTEDGRFTWPVPLWEQPSHRWSSMMDAGVRSTFVCCANAAKIMVSQRSGLIINVGYWAAQKYLGNAIYGMAKAATDKLTMDAAHELQPYGVCVISLYPGLVRTEAVLLAARQGWLDLSNSESPEFIGLVIAALANEPHASKRTGKRIVAATVAEEFRIKDIDGRQPIPLTLENA